MWYSMWKRIFFAISIAFVVLFGSHFLGEMLFSIDSLEKPAYVVETDPDNDKPGADKNESEPDVLVASDDVKSIGETVESDTADDVLALLRTASPEKGAKLFRKCKACHTSKKGGKNHVGPNLWDVVGRKIAGSADFKYSEVFRGKGGNWSFAELDAFLANPKNYAKGTKMSLRGVEKSEDRADLLVYLRSLSDAPEPLP